VRADFGATRRRQSERGRTLRASRAGGVGLCLLSEVGAARDLGAPDCDSERSRHNPTPSASHREGGGPHDDLQPRALSAVTHAA